MLENSGGYASMIGALLKLVLVVVILAVAAAFFLGYRFADNGVETPVSAIQRTPAVNTEKARETGAKIGETVATGAAKAEQALSEGALTAKIKSKMALDDTVKALSIDVDTKGTVVTLSGSVSSEAVRAKAVQLARETTGVTAVNDRLVVR
jgi:hyperosmotically inducible protein